LALVARARSALARVVFWSAAAAIAAVALGLGAVLWHI
jgi:hypothetical protein